MGSGRGGVGVEGVVLLLLVVEGVVLVLVLVEGVVMVVVVVVEVMGSGGW